MRVATAIIFLFAAAVLIGYAPALAAEAVDIKRSALKHKPIADKKLPDVQGVMTGGGRAIAWVGGEPYYKGQSVDGYKVLLINSTGVEFAHGDMKVFVALEGVK